jgi:predicted RNA binding protein with dsRBD fold (UPF0201 family)
MPKKLINFEDSQIEAIDQWATQYKKSFSEAVRLLVEYGIEAHVFSETKTETETDDIKIRINKIEEQVEKLSWWTSDDNTSRMGNIELKLEELEKHINILTKISKLFKAHIATNDIHLQDS